MSARMIFFALLVVFGTTAAWAGPPVSEKSSGWFALPSPTAWLPSVSGSADAESDASEGSVLQRATVGTWKSVTGGLRRGWRWTTTTLNPWSGRERSSSAAASPGLWQQLFAPEPERHVDTVTDFLAQPKPY